MELFGGSQRLRHDKNIRENELLLVTPKVGFK